MVQKYSVGSENGTYGAESRGVKINTALCEWYGKGRNLELFQAVGLIDEVIS